MAINGKKLLMCILKRYKVIKMQLKAVKTENVKVIPFWKYCTEHIKASYHNQILYYNIIWKGSRF